MKRSTLLLSLFLLLGQCLFCQDRTVQYSNKIDSLQKLINNNQGDDALKATRLAYLGQLYIINHLYLKGLLITQEAIGLFKKENNPAGQGYLLQAMALINLNSAPASGEQLFVFYIRSKWYFDKLNIKDSFPLYPHTSYLHAKISDEYIYSELLKAVNHFEKKNEKEILANLLFAISYNCLQQKKINECIGYINRSITLFKELNLSEPAFAAQLIKMKTFNQAGNTDSLKQFEQDAITQIIASDDTREKSLLCLSMFRYYYENNQQAKSLEYLLKTIAGFKELEEKKILIRLLDIAGDEIQIYGSPKKGYEFLQKEMKLRQELNDYEEVTYTYITTVFCLIKLANYNEALKYISLGENLAIKNNDSFFIAKCLDARGQLLMGQRKYGEAIIEFSKAATTFQSNSDWSESYQYGYIAACYFEMGKLNESIRFGSKSFAIGMKNKYIPVILMSAKSLSDAYAGLGNDQKSYEYLKIYADTKDKLLQSDVDNRLTDLETQSMAQEAQKVKEKLEAEKRMKDDENRRQKLWLAAAAACLLIVFSVAIILLKNNRDKKKANKMLSDQKNKIEETLADLKLTQAQLIQSEKMASLGELTAGIAHEIQNPLNFVNNFSDVNRELLEELKQEADKGNINEIKIIADDVISNEEKINHHGKRADAIVKGMLQHSRSSTGKKELTDINALCDEYLRLSYHGLRAKDKSFNATLKTDFDPSLGKINIIPQDIGRVVMNLLTNAFYAVNAKALSAVLTPTAADYEPTVSIRTASLGEGRGGALITVTDNGSGIPKNIIDKIFQPFFTTKPTGQGTGLGLSLSYDIITKGHGGELRVETKEGKGSTFIIQLPVN